MKNDDSRRQKVPYLILLVIICILTLFTSCGNALIYLNPNLTIHEVYRDSGVIVYSINIEAIPSSSSLLNNSRNVHFRYSVCIDDINDNGQASGYGFSGILKTDYTAYSSGYYYLEDTDTYSVLLFLAVDRSINFWDHLVIDGYVTIEVETEYWSQEYHNGLLIESTGL